MRNYSVLIVALLAFTHVYTALGSACTIACDNAANATSISSPATAGNFVTFCDTNGTTQRARQSALLPVNLVRSSCYGKCGVALLHLGTCGCPNDCYSDTGNGVCDTVAGQCRCNPGWDGADCTSVKCPNHCSHNGKCKSGSKKGGDYCECKDGWTAYDCSVRIPDGLRHEHGGVPFGKLPYGETKLTDVPYFQNDKNEDKDEFFNSSVLATVKLTLKDSDLKYLLTPNNVFHVEYVDATLYFYNGIISKTTDVKMRLKGSATRMDMKKSWNVKFQDTWRDMRGFTLKVNQQDRAVSSQLVVEFYRGMKAQTFRASLCEVWVNEMYQGLLQIQEKFDESFMESRFDVKDLNMYQVGAQYAMTYRGPNAIDYENLTNTLYDGVPQHSVSQQTGNGKYDDFAALVTAMNTTDLHYLTNHFDVPSFLRSMACEALTKNADGYTGTSNNYIFSESRKKNRPFWNYIAHDFDQALYPFELTLGPILGLTPAALVAMVNAGVTSYKNVLISQFIPSSNPYVVIGHTNKPMTVAVMKTPNANATYTAALQEFVNLFVIKKPGLVFQRQIAFTQLARPIVARDKMYTIQTGSNLAYFDSTTNRTTNWLLDQFGAIASQFYANGNGRCTAYGVCSCNPGYFGEKCDQYCGVGFAQVMASNWTSNGQAYSHWTVTMNVGANPLYSVIIQAAANGLSFQPDWNVELVPGSNNLYSIPAYKYTNGAIPAYSNQVSFSYTVNSASPVTLTLFNDACIPKACPVSVKSFHVSSWTSGSTTYQAYQLKIDNKGLSPVANVKLHVNFFHGSYIYQSLNLDPATTNPGQPAANVTCSLYNLPAGQTSSSCGYYLGVPNAHANDVDAEVHVAQAICI